MPSILQVMSSEYGDRKPCGFTERHLATMDLVLRDLQLILSRAGQWVAADFFLFKLPAEMCIKHGIVTSCKIKYSPGYEMKTSISFAYLPL